MITRFFPLLLLASVMACSKQTPDGIDWTDLYQHWTHSSEEQQDLHAPEHVYRPIGFKEFPPNFYRKQYVFRENGEVEWLWPSPADAHEMRAGTWEMDSQQHVIHVQEDHQRISYRVIELSKDRLVLRLLDE